MICVSVYPLNCSPLQGWALVLYIFVPTMHSTVSGPEWGHSINVWGMNEWTAVILNFLSGPLTVTAVTEKDTRGQNNLSFVWLVGGVVWKAPFLALVSSLQFQGGFLLFSSVFKSWKHKTGRDLKRLYKSAVCFHVVKKVFHFHLIPPFR